MKKIILLLLLVSMTFSGCSKKEEIVDDNPGGGLAASSQSPSSEEPPPVKKDVNPFTGEAVSDPQSLLNRPLAVMVNNIGAALPQRGIGAADVIFELPVEGGATRLMALFADYTKVPEIGSIRSSRHDYVELIMPFNPIYLHFGYSEYAKDMIEKQKVDSVNGIKITNTAFYQVKSRLSSMASEHTWFSNLEYLSRGIEKIGTKATLDKPIEPMFTFVDEQVEGATAMPATATPKLSDTVAMSGSATATFDYDAATGLYKKSQNKKPHIDETLGKAIEFRNVLVMFTDVKMAPNGKNKEIALESGSGYYLSEGKSIPVTFKKPTINDYLKAYDETGAELKINTGKTYICIAPK